MILFWTLFARPEGDRPTGYSLPVLAGFRLCDRLRDLAWSGVAPRFRLLEYRLAID